MICEKCNNELIDGAKFCGKCGNPITWPEVETAEPATEAPVIETPSVDETEIETPAVETPVVELVAETPVEAAPETPAVEIPVVETPAAEPPIGVAATVDMAPVPPVPPVIPPVDNATAIKEEFVQSNYVTADVPEAPVKEKKAKKKRPFVVALICGLLTFVLSLVLFVAVEALYVRTVFDGLKAQATGESVFGNVSYTEVPLGAVLSQVDEKVELEDDATISDYIYAKIPEEYQEKTNVEEIAEALDKAGLDEDIASIIEKINGVLTGEITEGALFSTDEIINMIETKKDVIEKVTGYTLSDDDFDKIKDNVEKLELEETTDVTKFVEMTEENEIVKVSMTAISKPSYTYIAVGGLIVVLLVLILLLNLNKPYKVFGSLGGTSIVVGALGVAGAIFSGIILNAISGSGALKTIVTMLSSGLERVMEVNGFIFLGAGVVLSLIGGIWGVIARRRAK